MAGDAPDAWRQMADLWAQFSQEWDVRPDLRVVALGPDRAVEFWLGHDAECDEFGIRWSWKTTKRNVGTMRELAEALLAACDFVDAANPEWAGRRPAVSEDV